MIFMDGTRADNVLYPFQLHVLKNEDTFYFTECPVCMNHRAIITSSKLSTLGLKKKSKDPNE